MFDIYKMVLRSCMGLPMYANEFVPEPIIAYIPYKLIDIRCVMDLCGIGYIDIMDIRLDDTLAKIQHSRQILYCTVHSLRAFHNTGRIDANASHFRQISRTPMTTLP